jgi:carbon-monoxide dehydrogenase medium subunit
MKPTAFEYVRAAGIPEAVRILAESTGAKVIAGGQSLGPMLNLRLAQPELLVDVTGIPAMTRIEEEEEAVTLGACVTTANVEDGRVPSRGLHMLPPVAARTAYRAVRNRGTIGGSLCHADPAADWVSALSAVGAQCRIAGPEGVRVIPIEDFVIGAFETALGPAELLEAIRIPRVSPAGRWGFNKLCRRTGEFALSIAAVLHDSSNDRYRMVIGGTGGRPIVVSQKRVPWDTRGSADSIELDQAAISRLLSEAGIDDPIARQWHSVVLGRAFDQVRSR